MQGGGFTVNVDSKNKKSPLCRLTERGAISYNKSRSTLRFAVWTLIVNRLRYETVTWQSGGFTF